MNVPLQRREGPFAQADHRLSRSVMLGLLVLGAMAIAVPLLSYQSDSREVHALFRARVSREGELYSQALNLYLQTLEAELVRLTHRPEIDLRDGTLAPERELLDFTHHNSALFTGVALLGVDGQPLGSEPKNLLSGERFSRSVWFQRMLASGQPAFGGLRSGWLVIAAPIIQAGQTTGAVIGLVDLAHQQIPGGQAVGDHVDLLLEDADGQVLMPRPAPNWTHVRASAPALAVSEGQSAERLEGARYERLTPVGHTGLTLWLSTDEDEVLAPMRARVLWQLFSLLLLELATVGLFSLYLRRIYRQFLELEARATQQEQLAVLGTAASLIAHEVKNSLNSLKAAATLLPSDEACALPAQTLRSQIDRLGHLARSLLQFGKPVDAQQVSVPLDEVVRQAVNGLRDLPEAGEVELRTELDAPFHVRGDPVLLVSALDNLVRNAIEAAASAKDLGLREQPWVRVSSERRGALACVVIEDDAGGPPTDFEAKMFAPFATSKPRGVGLGLLVARRALEQQGGTLEFERTVAGSRFIVCIALAEVAA
jgi:signal transduction histidine kinase